MAQWIGVTKRFRKFHNNVLLTTDQREDGKTKHEGVRKCLNSHYYGSASSTAHSFLVGSWGKYTRVRPLRDIDVYFVLPYSVYERFEEHAGNKQSALLQEVKNVLGKTYSTSRMRGDGQVVVVDFTSISVEIVPVFLLKNGQYYVCNTSNGGSYMTADPKAEAKRISDIHSDTNNNLRRVIRMLKAWQCYRNVPLKSFYIELLAADFLKTSEWRKQDYFYYDWIMRDFFKYLKTKANGIIIVPGTYEVIHLGDDWLGRCERAYDRSVEACDYEKDNYVALAGEKWQKIFGNQIPFTV